MPDPADDHIHELVGYENDIIEEHRRTIEDRADNVVQAIVAMIDSMVGPVACGSMQDLHLNPGAEHRETLKAALVAFIMNGEQ
jgi:hypothetical protein